MSGHVPSDFQKLEIGASMPRGAAFEPIQQQHNRFPATSGHLRNLLECCGNSSTVAAYISKPAHHPTARNLLWGITCWARVPEVHQ